MTRLVRKDGDDTLKSSKSYRRERANDEIIDTQCHYILVTCMENRVRMTSGLRGMQSTRCWNVEEICGESWDESSDGCACGTLNLWSMTCSATKEITRPMIAIQTRSEKLYRKKAPASDLEVLSTCVTTFIASKACSGKNSTPTRLGFSHQPDTPKSHLQFLLFRTTPSFVQFASMSTNLLKFWVPVGSNCLNDEHENPVTSCNAVNATIDSPSNGGCPTA